MLPRTNRLNPNTFVTDVSKTLFTFVQVDPSIGRQFPSFVAEIFNKKYPNLFAFATLYRPLVKDPSWWNHNFRSATGPIRNGVADGMWLFQGGLVVGHHASINSVDAQARFNLYFDEIVQRKMTVSGYAPIDDDGRVSAKAPAPPPPAPEDDDPYEILGIPRTATEAEIKAAWKEQMKLNHPDRVSHLSPALQKFALAQTVSVQKAYDAIMGRRR